MANKKHVVSLTGEDRERLLDLTREGPAGDRNVTLALILLMSDEGSTDLHIAQTVHVGAATVGYARKRFALGGIDAALGEHSRSRHRPKPARDLHALANGMTTTTDEPDSGAREFPAGGMPAVPVCGVQWTGTVAPNAEGECFTVDWPAGWHVIWTVMPITVGPGAPQLTWQVRVGRSCPEFVTYWVKVRNLTDASVSFVIRYAIVSWN